MLFLTSFFLLGPHEQEPKQQKNTGALSAPLFIEKPKTDVKTGAHLPMFRHQSWVLTPDCLPRPHGFDNRSS